MATSQQISIKFKVGDISVEVFPYNSNVTISKLIMEHTNMVNMLLPILDSKTTKITFKEQEFSSMISIENEEGFSACILTKGSTLRII